MVLAWFSDTATEKKQNGHSIGCDWLLVVRNSDPSLRAYLNEVGRHPLLKQEEEVVLGRKVQRLIELEEKIKSGEPLDVQEESEVFVGRRAKQKFVNSNLRLVVDLAKDYHHYCRSLELVDLIQEGNIALIRAVEKFDYSRGYKFSTYCYWWIRQAMQRAIGSLDSPIRLPTSFRDTIFKLNKSVEKLTKELNRRPTFDEIAEELGLSPEVLMLVIQRSQAVMSLDASIECEESSVTVTDSIEDLNNVNTIESLEFDVMMEELCFALENFLDDVARHVVVERSRPSPTAWRELEVSTGLSKIRLQRIEREAIEKCRVMIETHKNMGLGFDN